MALLGFLVQIKDSFLKGIKRMPLVVGVVSVLMAIIWNPGVSQGDLLEELGHYMSGCIGLAIGYAFVYLMRERGVLQGYRFAIGIVLVTSFVLWINYPILVGGNALLAWLPEPLPSNYMELRLIGGGIYLHLVITLVPLADGFDTRKLWHYNFTVLGLLIQAIFFSAVLCLGFAAAFFAIQVLFGLSFFTIYGRLAATFFVVFQTIFVLSNLPSSEPGVDGKMPFPRWVNLLFQWVLAPLLATYFLILTAYFVKVLIEWHLPNGMVTWPVLIYAHVGGFVFLLMYPIRHEAQWPWVGRVVGGFTYSLIPFVCLAAVGLWIRIDAYGITIDRYLGALVLSLLFVLALLYSFRRDAWMGWMPASFLAFVGLACIGPFNVVDVAARNQISHIKEAFEKRKGLTTDGKLLSIANKLPKDEQAVLSTRFATLPTRDSTLWSDLVEPKLLAEVKDSIRKTQPNQTPDFRFFQSRMEEVKSLLVERLIGSEFDAGLETFDAASTVPKSTDTLDCNSLGIDFLAIDANTGDNLTKRVYLDYERFVAINACSESGTPSAEYVKLAGGHIIQLALSKTNDSLVIAHYVGKSQLLHRKVWSSADLLKLNGSAFSSKNSATPLVPIKEDILLVDDRGASYPIVIKVQRLEFNNKRWLTNAQLLLYTRYR